MIYSKKVVEFYLPKAAVNNGRNGHVSSRFGHCHGRIGLFVGLDGHVIDVVGHIGHSHVFGRYFASA